MRQVRLRSVAPGRFLCDSDERKCEKRARKSKLLCVFVSRSREYHGAGGAGKGHVTASEAEKMRGEGRSARAEVAASRRPPAAASAIAQQALPLVVRSVRYLGAP